MAFSSKRTQKRRALFQRDASNSSTSHLDSVLKTIDLIREDTSKKRRRRKVAAKNAVTLDHEQFPLSEIAAVPFSTIDHTSQKYNSDIVNHYFMQEEDDEPISDTDVQGKIPP